METERQSRKKHLTLPSLRISRLFLQRKRKGKVCGTLFLQIPKRRQRLQSKGMSEPTSLVTTISGKLAKTSGAVPAYTTSQAQLELFRLADINYISGILAPIYDKNIPESISFSSSPNPIVTTISIQNGIMFQDLCQNNILLATDPLNNSNNDNSFSFTADFSNFLFMNDYNVVWSSNAAFVSGVPVQVIVKDDQGNILNTISQNWNTNSCQQLSQTFPNLAKDVNVPADSQLQANLYANKKIKTFRVCYHVSLSGNIAVNFSQPVNNQTNCQANVLTAQYLGSLPTYAVVTQDITFSYFENPNITIEQMPS